MSLKITYIPLKDELHLLAKALLEHRTLNRQEVEQVIKGEKLVTLDPFDEDSDEEVEMVNEEN